MKIQAQSATTMKRRNTWDAGLLKEASIQHWADNELFRSATIRISTHIVILRIFPERKVLHLIITWFEDAQIKYPPAGNLEKTKLRFSQPIYWFTEIGEFCISAQISAQIEISAVVGEGTVLHGTKDTWSNTQRSCLWKHWHSVLCQCSPETIQCWRWHEGTAHSFMELKTRD